MEMKHVLGKRVQVSPTGATVVLNNLRAYILTCTQSHFILSTMLINLKLI